MNDRRQLVVVSSLGAASKPEGKLVLTRKFVQGMQAYAAAWPGRVQAWMAPLDRPTANLDNFDADPDHLGFGVRLIDPRGAQADDLREAALVFAGLDWRTVGLGRLCRELGLPLVYGTEYSLRTRWQIARAELSDRWRLARRAAWELGLERRQRAALRLASGVQCNGTPTYSAYRKLTAQPLLFFDTRTREQDLVDLQALERRLQRLKDGGPLRLLFSGRLVEMKGVDHLPAIADALRERGVSFELRVCGAGALEAGLRRELAARKLEGLVRLMGTLDFELALQPMTREWADLFICPHVQGDPSCTYLETLACGVPIAGYANEAWRGLLALGNVGVASRVGARAELAAQVARLADDRARLAELSRNARRFAAPHTFERTFQSRVQHLLMVAGIESGDPQREAGAA